MDHNDLQNSNVFNPNNPDLGLKVRFFEKTVKDRYQTEQTGKDCFKKREYIEIINPAHKETVIVRPVDADRIFDEDGIIKKPSDIDRFPLQYKAFQQGLVQDVGLPIQAWSLRPDDGMIKALQVKSINTVEQLASFQGDDIMGIPDFYSLKQKAKKYLDSQNDDAAINKLITQNDTLQNELNELKQQMQDFNALNQKNIEALKNQDDTEKPNDTPLVLKVKSLKSKNALPEVA